MSTLFGGYWLVDQTQTQRIRTLDVQGDLLLRLLYSLDGKRRVEVQGLPEQLRCVGLSVDRYLNNTVRLYVESPEFQEVPIGALPLPLELTFVEHVEPQPETAPEAEPQEASA